MTPGPDQYVSFLMGANAIADEELTRLGVEILQGAGSPFRRLLVPAAALAGYRALIREKLTPGFWNDILGREEVLFVFKLADGTVEELTLSESTRARIAHLCSSLNGDPIEKTSDVLRYLAGNPFYREPIEAFHLRGRD